MMRRLLLAGAVLAASSAFAAPLRNIAPDFAAAYDATAQMPMPERVAAMKKAMQRLYPEFYGRFTRAEQDRRMQAAIEGFPAIRASYLEKANDFGGALQQHMATYQAKFPHFQLDAPTTVLHSLGEMNGGMRTLGPNGEQHLVFGADVIARIDPNGNAAPLFHHELFHVMHLEHFKCGDGLVWANLWSEGLATYVSEVMNPGANEKELMLDYPRGMPDAMRAQLPAAWKQLLSVLDRDDLETYREFFLMAGKSSGLPVRRGYYLGYLLAREAGKTRDLPALAALDCQSARVLVESTIRKLSTEGIQ
ncbi:hypothetical protein [Pseudoduganella violaceinigra]|uniref:hypothetical protein n=1 Tax=Pseudoduganella violaceinigra TaxID=246602 RepID=UPI00041289A8|nr:hypothetical protein [Pseudoduganella violaceinigra]